MNEMRKSRKEMFHLSSLETVIYDLRVVGYVGECLPSNLFPALECDLER